MFFFQSKMLASLGSGNLPWFKNAPQEDTGASACKDVSVPSTNWGFNVHVLHSVEGDSCAH